MMSKFRKAFTMIELVFVIVVLGILSAIAIPKFAATRVDAQISSAKATISSVRSGIVSARQRFLLQGESDYITKLSQNATTLFDGNGTAGYELLMYPINASTENGHWSGNTNGLTYTFHVQGQSCTFTYTPANGKFTMNANQNIICDPLRF